jgi:hypothetical protein
MKFTLPIALGLATSTSAQYLNQSEPFNLVLVSENATVNGDTLSSCHTGAAIESLCLSNSNSTSKPEPIPAAVFTFNTSESVFVPNATLGVPGIVTWTLPASPPIPEALGLSFDPTTNVALPLLWPGDSLATTMAFDSNNLLNIQGYVDDTVDPIVAGNYTAYYRWYSCNTYYAGYQYVTLAWKVGEGEPQNPSCIKVDVKRVFI